jgi:hypothetical protein
MSLNWDVTEIRNQEVVTTLITEDGTRKWHPVTEALVWACMAVDIGRITEKNWQEFYTRVNMYESILGPFLNRYNKETKEHKEVAFTPLEVYSHIGLRTNVSDKTTAQFLKKLHENAVRNNELITNQATLKYIEEGIATKTLPEPEAVS